MISAGEGTTPTVTTPASISQPQGMQTVGFTPIMISPPSRGNRNSNNNNTNTNIKLSGEQGLEMAKESGRNALISQAMDSVVDTISMGFQYGLAMKAMDCQYKIANKYYDTQGKIAGFQREVALKQLEVQFAAVNAQQQMHSRQTYHEETMARLEGSTQARLASISEQGKTDRAKVLAVTDAFSRRGYDYGSARA